MSRFCSVAGQLSINFWVHLWHLKTVIINYIPGRARVCAQYQGNRTLAFIMHQVLFFFCLCSTSYTHWKHGLLLEECIIYWFSRVVFIHSLVSHASKFSNNFCCNAYKGEVYFQQQNITWASSKTSKWSKSKSKSKSEVLLLHMEGMEPLLQHQDQ